jgi:hypothetical protein
MAGRGSAPKETLSRARDQQRREAEITVVQADGQKHGPDLPDGVDWPDQTLDWWETWRGCAQASTFTDTDWSFLLDTAVLHMAFWDGDHTTASELRLRSAKFGATPEDRARLKIAVGEPDKGPVKRDRPPAAARTRRDRVLKAVSGD